VSNARAHHRRAARRRSTQVPAVPGVIADRYPATIQRATNEAHELLPAVPGTAVFLALFDPDDGEAAVRGLFGDDGAELIRERLAALPADAEQPTVLIASRQYPEPTNHERRQT